MESTALQFHSFVDAVRLGAEDIAQARAAAAEVAGVLRRHWRPQADPGDRDDHLVVGSIGKRTAVRPAPPVDLLWLLPEAAGRSAPPEAGPLLSALAALLGSELPVLRVTGTAVLVGRDGVEVAVIPAVPADGAYLVNADAGWAVSNPVAEMAALRLADGLSDGRAGELLALAKAWRGQCAVPVGGFALEVLVREFLAEAPRGQALAAAFADFLVWARRRTPRDFELPGGLGRLAVGDSWHSQAEAAYWRCVLAGRHLAGGDRPAATAEWRQMFGVLFPAPPEDSGWVWRIPPDLG